MGQISDNFIVSPDYQVMARVDPGVSSVRIWDIESNSQIQTIHLDPNNYNILGDFSSDNAFLCITERHWGWPGAYKQGFFHYGDVVISVYRVDSGLKVHEYVTVKDRGTSTGGYELPCTFSPDSQYFIEAENNTLRLVSSRDWSEIYSVNIGSQVRNVLFSPNSKYLAVNTLELVIIYQVSDMKEVKRFYLSPTSFDVLKFSTDGSLFSFLSDKKLITVVHTSDWSISDVFSADYEVDRLADIYISPNNQYILVLPFVVLDSQDVLPSYLWRVQDGELIHKFYIESDNSLQARYKHEKQIAFSPGSDSIAFQTTTAYDTGVAYSITPYHTLQVFNINDDQVTNEIPTSMASYYDLSPTSNVFAGNINGYIYLWNLDNLSQLGRIGNENDLGWIDSQINFTPDGNRIAIGTIDGRVLIWNVNDGTLSDTIKVGQYSKNFVQFSPDGNFLAIGGMDSTVFRNYLAWRGEIALWDLRNNQEIKLDYSHFSGGHIYQVKKILFTPDGKYLWANLELNQGSAKAVFRWKIDVCADNLTQPGCGLATASNAYYGHFFELSPNGEQIISFDLKGFDNGIIGHYWKACQRETNVESFNPDEFNSSCIPISDPKEFSTVGHTLGFSDDSQLLVYVYSDSSPIMDKEAQQFRDYYLQIWDPHTREMLTQIEINYSGMNPFVHFNSDNSLIIVNTRYDQTVQIFGNKP